jgi:hypothetical protein
LLIIQLEDPLRGERLSCQRGKTVEDGYGGLAVELLVNNGLGQAVKLRRSEFHPARAHPLNDGAHNRVRLLEVIDGLAHGI